MWLLQNNGETNEDTKDELTLPSAVRKDLSTKSQDMLKNLKRKKKENPHSTKRKYKNLSLILQNEKSTNEMLDKQLAEMESKVNQSAIKLRNLLH